MSTTTGGPRVPTGTRAVWLRAAVVIGVFVAVLWVLEALDFVLGGRLDGGGVQPRSLDGLWGVVWAPLLHYGFGHLVGNTVPLLVLGFLVLLSGIARWVVVTATTWVVGGIGTWLVAGSNETHLGASVLVFGWLSYLLVRGVLNRSVGQVLLGLVLLVAYGGLLWGVLPGVPGVSWQGHLFGAVGGVLAAVLLARRGDRRDRRSPAPAFS